MKFANGTSQATEVHGYPLPKEGRQYRPTYSGGRYVLPNPHGTGVERFTRVTTGAGTLDDKSNLDTWKTSNVVLGLKDHPELLDSLDLFDDPSNVRRAVRKIATKAQEIAGAKQASELGTAIHAWTEAVERDGLSINDVPTEFQPYVQAYMNALVGAGISTEPGMVERIVYNSYSGWVGTLDRVYRLPDDTLVIGDVKTSKTLKYGYLSYGMQLATYATADKMLSLDGETWEDMPPISNVYGVIAHVPSDNPGHCELVTMDIAAGLRALELSVEIIDMRRNAHKYVPGLHELPTPSLEDMVKSALDQQQLAQLYEAYADQWNDELTQMGVARLEKLAANSVN